MLQSLTWDVLGGSHQAALALGIVLLCRGDATARETFADAVARCRDLLNKTAGLYEPRYALATALEGQVVCDPRWAKESERAGLLARHWRNIGERWITAPRLASSVTPSGTWR